MKLDSLLQSNDPHIHSLVAEDSAAHNALHVLESRGAVVRFVRGRKATTTHALFDEMSATLQFPPHFGENWDATLDCLRDAAWVSDKASSAVIVFQDAAKLLESAPPADSKTLISVLNQLAADLAASKTRKLAFHAVFQVDPKDTAVLSKRWPGLPSLG